MLDDFKIIGADLFISHLITSHGGNMSIRVGDRVLITRRGSMLAHLGEEDVVETGLFEDDSSLALASTEVIVHKAIYLATNALAVIHAHPVEAIVRSLSEDEIIPADSEGSYFLHKVPVVALAVTAGSKEMADIISNVLKKYKICMLRGHGTFAIGQLLEEAFQWTSVLETSCRILNGLKRLGGGAKEYRSFSDEYEKW
ncbi:MAG: aldolase [Chloroflexi bacterium]|nr:aldolase [Chloroflexota bacterium]